MLFFIGLFLITAPILVLFAKGYRFDSQGKIFVYSGSITIKSWPRSVDIYVNNKKQEKKKLNVINGSYTINGVRPGKYSIRAEKENYTSWAKEVEVHSGISTEFWNVVLFPTKDREIKTYSPKNVRQFFLSPRDEEELVVFSQKEDNRSVSILSTNDNKEEVIFETDALSFPDKNKKQNLEWSSDNKRILIPLEKGDLKEFVIARIKKEGLKDVVNLSEVFQAAFVNNESFNETIPEELLAQEESRMAPGADETEEDLIEREVPKFEKVRWMFDKNDELVILTDTHQLFYLNIEKPNEMILLDKQVSGFDFAGNRIYYTQLPNNLVWEIKNNDISTKRQITNSSILSEQDDFIKLIAYDQYRIAVITTDRKLILYNNEKEKSEVSMETLGSNVEDIQFSDDGKKLLFWTDNEIWCLMLRDWEVQPIRTKGDKLFITRFSSPVKNVQWMEDYENIVFTTNGTVKSSSIDTRDHTNIVDILKNEATVDDRDVFYSKSSQQLFIRLPREDSNNLQSTILIDKGGFLGL